MFQGVRPKLPGLLPAQSKSKANWKSWNGFKAFQGDKSRQEGNIEGDRKRKKEIRQDTWIERHRKRLNEWDAVSCWRVDDDVQVDRHLVIYINVFVLFLCSIYLYLRVLLQYLVGQWRQLQQHEQVQQCQQCHHCGFRCCTGLRYFGSYSVSFGVSC